MSDEDIPVLLSQAAYRQLPQVQGWTRDNSLSNQNRSVYTKGGKAVVSYRGSDFKNKNTRWDDLGSDILIGLGLQDLSSRNKNARHTADLAAQKYGRDNVSLVGHSLGGSQAAYVSRKTGLKGTGYNTGWSPVDALRKRTYSNFTNYVADGDLIGGVGRLVKGLKNVVVKSKSKNKHNLVSFL